MFESLFGDVPRELGPMMAHVLWRVDYRDPLATGYSILNLIEAAFWFAIAGWVIRRHIKRGGGAWNWAYAGAFVLFGVSDVIESQIVPIGLIVAKGLILAAILLLRGMVIRRYYPMARM